MTDIRQLVADLSAEQDSLDLVVAPLVDHQWALPTPSPGWTISDQIGHLTYFDGSATVAIENPDEFRSSAAALLSSGDIPGLTLGRGRSSAEKLVAWRTNRKGMIAAAERLDGASRVPWYGPPMGAKSFLTARIMEYWAHGQDVCDTVGAPHTETERLRHIAHLGFITREWTYRNRQLELPPVLIRVELTAPSGEVWTFGDPRAPESVGGPAVDFCLVVTQRRHVDDTRLDVVGAGARDWMEKAQAYAGSPTDGPRRRETS